MAVQLVVDLRRERRHVRQPHRHAVELLGNRVLLEPDRPRVLFLEEVLIFLIRLIIHKFIIFQTRRVVFFHDSGLAPVLDSGRLLLLGFISAATNFFLPNIRVEEADQIVIVEKRLAFPPELSAPG